MNNKFSEISKVNLLQCHMDLQLIMNEVVDLFDISIIEGHRGKADQERMVRDGKSTLHYPDSNHNTVPSLAVDIWPYPIDMDKALTNLLERAKFYYMAGIVMTCAVKRGISLRWGGDWDGDNSFSDQSFHDLPHFELVGYER